MPPTRARSLGIPFDGTPGRYNAITDVAGVAVGHTTLISGEGKLKVGQGPVRTGVTAVLPRGKLRSPDPVFAAWFTLNGCGEMTGTTWLEESGYLYGPAMITNTLSVSVVRDATIAWGRRRVSHWFSLPVVAETYDGDLNDIRGEHVQPKHVWAALDSASSGPVAEGNVGGGTGMVCHDFKGGIGTASRRLAKRAGGYAVGVLVQANHGSRRHLRIAGAPVGAEITDLMPGTRVAKPKTSSIIAILATDCPLLPHQLKRLAKRIPLGIAQVGGIGEVFSGDIFLAFSTARPGKENKQGIQQVPMYPHFEMDALFEATVQATEEAIVNALVAAKTMTGINSYTVYALPHERLRDVLRKFNRLNLSLSLRGA
jgi:D-aminopeptidase